MDYFVSFFAVKDGDSFHGRASVMVPGPVSSLDRLKRMESAIKKELSLDKCVITNWRRFEPEE